MSLFSWYQSILSLKLDFTCYWRGKIMEPMTLHWRWTHELLSMRDNRVSGTMKSWAQIKSIGFLWIWWHEIMSVNIACVSEDMILFRYSQLNGADFTGFTDLRGLRGIRGPTPNLYHLYFSFIHMNMNMDLTITILVHKSQTAEFHCNVLLLLNAIFRYKENRNRVKKFNFFIRQPWRGWAEIGRQGRTKWRLLRGVSWRMGLGGRSPTQKLFRFDPPFQICPPPFHHGGRSNPSSPPI